MAHAEKIPADKCLICNQGLLFSWTDTHGVAQCLTCGAPYRIYHYEDNKRIEKLPELLLKPEYVDSVKQYYNETKRTIPSGYSLPGGQELASIDDHNYFFDWMETHEQIKR